MAPRREMIHLDLRGFPPTPERLIDLIPAIGQAGFGGILFEFADMFPWQADVRFRNETVYPEEVISAVDSGMKRQDLEIGFHLNLFSSMEYMLGLPSYRHLAVTESDCSSIHPHSIGSKSFIETLIDDVISLLPGTTVILFGGIAPLTAGLRSAVLSDPGATAGFLADIDRYADESGVGALFGKSLLDSISGRFTPGHPIVEDLSMSPAGSIPPRSGGSSWACAQFTPADGEIPDRDCFRDSVRNISADLYTRTESVPNEPALFLFSTRSSHHSPQNMPFEVFLRELCRSRKAPLEDGDDPSPYEEVFWDLSEKLEGLWKEIRAARRYLSMATVDARRRSRHPEDLAARIAALGRKMDEACESAESFRRISSGINEPLWVERFLQENLEPVREEIGLIQSRTPSVTE